MAEIGFGRGESLQFIRDDRNWKQDELAGEANRLWTDYLRRQIDEAVDPDQHVGRPNRKPTLRVAISRYELNARPLSKDQLKFICEALDIPTAMLERRFESKSAFEDYYQSWLKTGSGTPKTPASESKPLSPRQELDDLMSPTAHMSFLQRRSIGEMLEQEILISNRPSIIHLSGMSGSGKSTFLGFWFEFHGRRLKNRDVLAINLENRTGDDLYERLTRYCEQIKLDRKGRPHETFFSLRKPILILDSLERFNTSETIGAPLSQTIAIQAIIDHIANNDLNAKILLVTASDLSRSHAATIEAARSAARGNWSEIEIAPVGMSDAVRYLTLRNIGQSEEERKSIHAYFGGNGTLIAAYANLNSLNAFSILGKDTEPMLNGTPDVEARVMALSKLFHELADEEPMTYFVCCILASCHESIALDDLEQTAELMLSAGLPAGNFGASLRFEQTSKTRERLREAVRKCFSGKIANFIRSSAPVSHIQRQVGKSFREPPGLAFHYLAKKAFHRSADDILGRADTALIHYTLTCVLANKTPTASGPDYMPQVKHIEDFHSIIFHLTQLFEARTELNLSNHEKLVEIILLNIGPAEDKQLFDELTLGRLSLGHLQLNPGEYLGTLYVLVMRKTLGLEQHPTTRQLGSFERKLSMLSNFLQLDRFTNDAAVKVKPELAEWSAAILRDIVVCANHCGKIELAHRAARALLLAIGDDRGMIARAIGFLNNPTNETDREEIRLLNKRLDDYSGFIATSATSYMREGEISIALNLVSRALGADSQRIGADAKASRHVVDRSHKGIPIAIRRLVAKLAQLYSISGRVDQAYALYDTARVIEIVNGNKDVPHRGDSGRAYVRMLSSYFDKQTTGNEVLTTIGSNTNYASRKNRFHEVVEWKVEEAWFHHKHVDFDSAKSALSDIESISAEHSLQVSYGTLREIELLRMLTISSVSPKKFEANFVELCESLESTRHTLLLIDALAFAGNFMRKDSDIESFRKKAAALCSKCGVDGRWLRFQAVS